MKIFCDFFSGQKLILDIRDNETSFQTLDNNTTAFNGTINAAISIKMYDNTYSISIIIYCNQ